MKGLADASIQELIRPGGFACCCGKIHKAGIRFITIGSGEIASVPVALRVLQKKHPMVICGPNGYQAAGAAVCRQLEQSCIPFTLHVIRDEENVMLRPAEFAVGSAALHFDHETDVVIGVGSGVINDICKVLGRIAKIPCMIVGTAPSMDGFASDGSSMEVDGIKLSLKEQVPEAIICDTEVLKNAPMHMIHAGIGDILAKTTSLFDWEISSIVTGEHYCCQIADLVGHSLQEVMRLAPKAVLREQEAIGRLAEGLVLSGISMAFEGTSHPASGLDHYFSHCWEMMKLERGEQYELHGIQVGVGMLLTLKIAYWLQSVRPDMSRVEKAITAFDSKAWEDNIRRVFPKSAEGILQIETLAEKNNPDGRRSRAEKIISAWDDILALAAALPAYEDMANFMRQLGMPTKPEEIGVGMQEVLDAFICSRDIRDKYILTSMIWDIGYMEECSKWLEAELGTLL